VELKSNLTDDTSLGFAFFSSFFKRVAMLFTVPSNFSFFSVLLVVLISSVARNKKSVEDETIKNLGHGVRGLASQTRREAGIPLLSGA
jgi:hypothetical protein